jgi:proline iminopeptidase
VSNPLLGAGFGFRILLVNDDLVIEHVEELNGVELYFEDSGTEDAPVIVFLHGGPGYNSYSFRDLVGEYLEHYRVIYLDQRGCGRSSEPEPEAQNYTIDALVSDLEAVREFLGIEVWTPLGHGFGALLALEYARRFPERTQKVIAINPWIHYPELSQVLLEAAARITEHALTEIPEKSEDRIEKAFSMLNARDLISRLHFPSPQSRLRLEFSDAESTLLAGGTMQEMLVFNGLWDFEYPNYLADITKPILVIASTQDITSYPSQTDWLVDLAGAEIVELEAGHYPWLEQPDQFANAVAGFLTFTDSKRPSLEV